MKTYFKKEVISQIKSGIPVSTVCANLHIGRSTIYRWMKYDKHFAKLFTNTLMTRMPVLKFNLFNLEIIVRQK